MPEKISNIPIIWNSAKASFRKNTANIFAKTGIRLKNIPAICAPPDSIALFQQKKDIKDGKIPT